MSIQIRLAGADDFELVDELVRAAYEYDYGPREHGDDPVRLAANRSKLADVWVALDDEELVGTITIRSASGASLQEDTRADELDFRLLGVDPTHRGRGLGKHLTEHAISIARERGNAGVFLKSAPDMIGAHRLYENLGFTRAPHRDGLVIGGEVVLDLFAFELPLSATSASPSATRENEYV